MCPNNNHLNDNNSAAKRDGGSARVPGHSQDAPALLQADTGDVHQSPTKTSLDSATPIASLRYNSQKRRASIDGPRERSSDHRHRTSEHRHKKSRSATPPPVSCRNGSPSSVPTTLATAATSTNVRASAPSSAASIGSTPAIASGSMSVPTPTPPPMPMPTPPPPPPEKLDSRLSPTPSSQLSTPGHHVSHGSLGSPLGFVAGPRPHSQPRRQQNSKEGSPLTPPGMRPPGLASNFHPAVLGSSHGHSMQDSSSPPVFLPSPAPPPPPEKVLSIHSRIPPHNSPQNPARGTPRVPGPARAREPPFREPPRVMSSPPAVPPAAAGGGGSGGGGSSSNPHSERPKQRFLIELQPETRPISLTQLVNEVKGIYVGLVMVESKCIEIDSEQGMGNRNLDTLTNDQWQALITLHRTLLHEHHDFMLASQHPSASPALRRLAQKYAMPARMWRHGIHSFLELLRHRLPASREHMVTFIYLAYSMMALLYETVSAFEDTWVECLGDLSRYRMAIEDDNQRVRDTWTGVSRHWYTVASDRAPTTGRLYHHLAILARPRVVTQMYFYIKSLCVPIPFTSTRESILTLFEPILNGNSQRAPAVEVDFTMAHAILFTGKLSAQFQEILDKFRDALDVHIARTAKEWSATGSYMAIVNSCGLLHYGGDDNAIMKLLRRPLTSDAHASASTDAPSDVTMSDAGEELSPSSTSDVLDRAHRVATDTDNIVFERLGDVNCNAYIHVRLVWMLFMARLPEAMAYLEKNFSWNRLVTTLNHMMATYTTYDRIEQEILMTTTAAVVEEPKNKPEEPEAKPLTGKEEPEKKHDVPVPQDNTATATGEADTSRPLPRNRRAKPLPEDWALRGLLWAEGIFPLDWFHNDDIMDDDEKLMETGATALDRKERILWLACRLAQYKRWIFYDSQTHRFSVAPEFRGSDTRSNGNRASMDSSDGPHDYENRGSDRDSGSGNDQDDKGQSPDIKSVAETGIGAGAGVDAKGKGKAIRNNEDGDINLSDMEELARVKNLELQSNIRERERATAQAHAHAKAEGQNRRQVDVSSSGACIDIE